MILNFDVKSFLADFKKWGPSARTCIELARGSLTKGELQSNVTRVAREFAQAPATITMRGSPQEFSDVLFTVTPIYNDNRSVYTSRITSPYLLGLVMEEVAQLNAAAQVSFYHQTSTLPQFRETWGYMLETYFLV